MIYNSAYDLYPPRLQELDDKASTALQNGMCAEHINFQLAGWFLAMPYCAELQRDHCLEDETLNKITVQLKAFAETGDSSLEHAI
jgi:hypothetical protein